MVSLTILQMVSLTILQMVSLTILQTPFPCLLDVGHCTSMVWNHSLTNRKLTESVEYRQTEEKENGQRAVGDTANSRCNRL